MTMFTGVWERESPFVKVLVVMFSNLSSAKNEFRAKNSNTRVSLFSTEAEEVSQLAWINSGNKLQSQKEGP